MALLSGDSLAVGLAAYIHHVKIDARVGRASKEGAAHIRRFKDDTVYVSLGANDPRGNAAIFRKRVRLIVRGRECVAWLQVPNRPDLNRILQSQSGVKLVSGQGVRRSDGIHPGREGYRVLAKRMTTACPPPRSGTTGVPSGAPPLPETAPGVPSLPLPDLPKLPAPPVPLPPIPPLG